MNTTDQYITVPVTTLRGQPSQFQQIPNPDYNPQTDPQAVAIAQQTPAVLSNTPNNAGALTAPQQAPAQAVPQSSPILSRVSPALAMPQRPAAPPSAPAYGGSVGMSMLAGSQANAAKGGNAMFAGMADGYNKGKQAEYNANLNTYKAEQKQYEDGVARYNTAVTKRQEKQKALAQALSPLQMQLGKLQNAKARLDVQGSNITGMNLEDYTRFTDKFNSSDEATQRQMTRKILQDIGVDYTLLKVAQTKGAISEKEMELFASPQPNANATEEVWKAWLDSQIQAMESVMSNMVAIENGQMAPSAIDYSAQINALGMPSSGGSSQTTPKPAAPPTDAPTIQGKHGAYKQVTPQ